LNKQSLRTKDGWMNESPLRRGGGRLPGLKVRLHKQQARPPEIINWIGCS